MAEAAVYGGLKPARGHQCWLRTYPWVLLAGLGEAIQAAAREPM
jgi:hypothetical protein